MTRDDASQRGNPWQRDVVALALLALALLPFNGAALLGRIPHDADNTLFYVPFFSLFALKPFALWNPFQFCGMPLIGNLQYAMFYPPRLVFRFFEATHVYGPFCLMHWLVAAWGCYALGRVLRFRRGAAMLGALTFACGSFIQGRVSNPTLFISAVWFPALLAAWLQALKRGELHAAAGAAVMLALMAHAGSPHNTFYAGVMLGVAWIWRMAAHTHLGDHLGNERLKPLPALGSLLVFGALFLAMFAPLWWHAMELLPHTIRAQASFADVTADPLRLSEIPRLWFGGIGTPEYLDKTSYGGMLVVVLVLAAAARWGRNYAGGGFFRGPGGLGLVLVVVGILTALGARGGIYHLIYAVPGFRFLIGPTRALILFNVGWALVAMHLAHDFLEWLSDCGIRRGKKSGAVVLDVLAPVALAAVLIVWIRLDATSFMALGRPRFADPLRFSFVFGGFWLVVSAAIVGFIALGRVRAAAIVPLLLAVHVANLFHFEDRLIIHYEKPDYFREPETVRFLRSQAQEEPWRLLSWEPARMHPMDVFDTRGLSHLTPKLPDFYRLREVQGYDPMMLRDYVEFMTLCAGRNPVDDPWRTAHVADPTTLFTDIAGARYVIGCPWEVVLSRDPGRRRFEVKDPRPAVAIGITSLCDSKTLVRQGEIVGSVRLTLADGQTSTLPVRAGQETASVQATDPDTRVGHEPIETNLRWRQYDSRQGREIWWANYYHRIALPSPVPVRSIEWAPFRPDTVIFLIQNLVAEFEPPSDQRQRFTEVFRKGSIAICENHRAVPRAYVVHRILEADDLSGCVAALEKDQRDISRVAVVPSATRLDPGSDGEDEPVEIVSSDSDSARLRVKTDSPGLLVFTESWYPGWRVWIGGHEAETIRVNGIYQGVAIPSAGSHVVEFAYRPRSLAITLCIAAIGLATALVLALRHRYRHRPATEAV